MTTESGSMYASESAPASERINEWPPTVYYIKPSGFCAGIVRTEDAIRDATLMYPDRERYLVGTPAHNQTVINRVQSGGWKMVNSIDLVPEGVLTVLGPHGSTEEDYKTARNKGLTLMDTVCPLVVDVQKGVKESLREGNTVIVWGKPGHAETRAHIEVDPEEFDEESRRRLLLGTTPEQILSEGFLAQVENPNMVAFYAQTTHNADEAIEIRGKLKERFPGLRSLKTDGICFATRDRQEAVKNMAQSAFEKDESLFWIVVGDETSSNSQELYRLATQNGAAGFFVLKREQLFILYDEMLGYDAIAVTAGASAPQSDIDGVLDFCVEKGSVLREMQTGRDESNIRFKIPPIQAPGTY